MSSTQSFKGKTGSAFASMVPDWAASQTDTCDCRNMQIKMDKLGPSWVENNRQYVISRILNNRDALKKPLRIMPTITLRLAIGKMLDRAIELSK